MSGRSQYVQEAIRCFVMAVIVLAIIAAADGSAAKPVPVTGPPLKTGVSLGNVLTWGRANSTHTDYLWPVYEGREFTLPIGLLRKVKAYGFDFVRLTVDPGP